MKTAAMTATLIAFTLFSAPAFGEEPTQDVVPVSKGEAAPFTGLLVPELRLTSLLEAEVKAEGLAKDLKLQLRYNESLEQMFSEQLKKATAPMPWYTDYRLHLTVGFIIGVAVTALAVYGGAKIVEAGNGH